MSEARCGYTSLHKYFITITGFLLHRITFYYMQLTKFEKLNLVRKLFTKIANIEKKHFLSHWHLTICLFVYFHWNCNFNFDLKMQLLHRTMYCVSKKVKSNLPPLHFFVQILLFFLHLPHCTRNWKNLFGIFFTFTFALQH